MNHFTEQIQIICEAENLILLTKEWLSGGDTNQVMLLTTNKGKLVLKMNDKQQLPLFQTEVKGLEVLRKAKALTIPEVIAVGKTELVAYLLLEYIQPTKVSRWEHFGERLALLHQRTASHFGFQDNYIGHLPQSNGKEKSMVEFYIHHRLQPQFQLAVQNGYPLNQWPKFIQRIKQYIPEEAPALIHGDLWKGNVFYCEKGFVLIDPAVSYGPREMDLAMMRLFGGFPKEVFSTYDAVFPLPPGYNQRIKLWQLYYLLVHLNIFGSSYLGAVKNIIKNYD